MANLEKRIEELRAELEALYIRAKAGKACLEEVLQKSSELDELLLMERAYRNSAEPTRPAEP
jgi:hypothetical protein